MNELIPTVQFTDLVDQLLGELAEDDHITKQQIESTMQTAPLPTPMLHLLHLLTPPTTHKPIILSNANTYYIDTILKCQPAIPGTDTHVSDLFQLVITNPALFHPAEPNRLHVARLYPRDQPPVDCPYGCSANMCKGKEVEGIWAGTSGISPRDTISATVYVGDGNNDYCPAAHLSSSDYLLCRTGRGLERRIKADGNIKATIFYWDTHEQVYEWVKNFLKA